MPSDKGAQTLVIVGELLLPGLLCPHQRFIRPRLPFFNPGCWKPWEFSCNCLDLSLGPIEFIDRDSKKIGSFADLSLRSG